MGKALTRKQRAFVDAVIDPDIRTYADAYRQAYSAENMSNRAVRVEAARLHAHPGVVSALDKARTKMEKVKARTAIMERQAVKQKLWDEVDNYETPSASRVAALRLLGIEAGMFAEKSKIEVSEPIPDSDIEIMAEIESMLSSDIIDD